MEKLIYFTFIAVLIAFKVFWDWYAKNKQKRVISHVRSAIIDVVLYSAAAIYFFGLIHSIAYIILSLSLRWIAFDLFFNLANGDRWNHLGKSSKLDIFLSRFKYPILIKLIPVAVGATLLLWL